MVFHSQRYSQIAGHPWKKEQKQTAGHSYPLLRAWVHLHVHTAPCLCLEADIKNTAPGKLDPILKNVQFL